MKCIKFDCFWNLNHWYLLPSISLHNFENQFDIHFCFAGLLMEIAYIKKYWRGWKMNDRYLFKGKTCSEEWVIGLLAYKNGKYYINNDTVIPYACEVRPDTICQCTSLKDKNGNLIWENDVLMCNDNPKDLVKVAFGEFAVIDVDTLEEIDGVIGWHYEVIPTDEISRQKPFCLSMPLIDFYINRCDMEVLGSIFDNPELLEVE